MKVIAKQVITEYLVELEEDEVEELGGDSHAAIVRAEGADNRPRMWVRGIDGLRELVDELHGADAWAALERMLRAVS